MLCTFDVVTYQANQAAKKGVARVTPFSQLGIAIPLK